MGKNCTTTVCRNTTTTTLSIFTTALLISVLFGYQINI